MEYKINELAKLAQVTIRQLHHYDHIGLLVPNRNDENGYRVYNDEHVFRLQQILFLKELDFSLVEMKEIFSKPHYDLTDSLLQQKQLLIQKRNRMDQLIQTIDSTLLYLKGEKEMEKKDLFKHLTIEEIKEHELKYEEEVNQKYDKELVRQSKQRTKNYTKEDWTRIQSESSAVVLGLLELMNEPVDHPKVQHWVKEWHRIINTYYYDCSLNVLKGLGELYVTDDRFKQNYDQHKEGLAQFFHLAINEYVRLNNK